MSRENNFASTSLHLHFTDWSLPVENFKSRSVDQDAYFVESVIALRDHGKWVADLDILSIDFESLQRLESKPCTQFGHKTARDAYRCSSIDTWDELLEFPESPAIFRARGNWAARLAAVSILAQKGQQHAVAVIGSRGVCLGCLETEGSDIGLQDYEGVLPAFCID